MALPMPLSKGRLLRVVLRVLFIQFRSIYNFQARDIFYALTFLFFFGPSLYW